MEAKDGIVFYSEEDEKARLQELCSLDVLFTKPEKSFDRITEMVATIFKMPVVLISLITDDRQWFKSCVGLSGALLASRGTEREASFCQYVIAHKELLVVPDTLHDDRFVHNRLVEGDPHIRFYAGAPLRTRKSNILGTLCVIDFQPRTLEPSDLNLLQQFADIVIDEIEYRDEIMLRRSAENQLRSSEERYKNLVELSPDLILVYQDEQFIYANPSSIQWFNLYDKLPPYNAQNILAYVDSVGSESLINHLHLMLQQNKPEALQQEVVLRTVHNTKADIMVTISKITFNSQDAIMIVARDISYQKQAERMILEMNQTLKEISFKDGLTNIANRRSMDDYLESEWQQAIQLNRPISIILIDIDFFKLYNDTYGHVAGDRCLIEVTTCIKDTLTRSSDLVARYGGEEFAVILPQTESYEAVHIAELIRSRVALLQIPHSSSAVCSSVTISLGVVTLTPNQNSDSREALKLADQALYEAKHRGRNCVSVFH